MKNTLENYKSKEFADAETLMIKGTNLYPKKRVNKGDEKREEYDKQIDESKALCL